MKRTTAFLLVVLATCPPATAQHVAFRLTDLDLRDPHTHASLILFGCEDITDSVPLSLGQPFNDDLELAITTDENNDGDLDLNGLLVFLDAQVTVGTGPTPNGTLGAAIPESGELITHFGSCTAPMNGTMCSADLQNSIQRVAYTATGQPCLTPYAGTTRPYDPEISTPIDPCFATDPFELQLVLAGFPVTLTDAQLSGTLVGSPPSMITNGLVRGFLAETVADSVTIPLDVAHVGGNPMSSVLPGGADCCASHDDRDLGLDGTTAGWWVYFNFEAEAVMMDATTAAVIDPPRIVRNVRLGPAIPNPFYVDTTLSFVMGQAGAVRVAVVDAAGRRVRTLREGFVGAGAHTVTWGGTDSRGRVVASGVYFVRLETAQGGRTRKVVLTR